MSFATQLIYTSANKESYAILQIDENDQVKIFEPLLKLIMTHMGIHIPALHQIAFEGREFVKLGDTKFAEAFRRIQVANYDRISAKGTYRWKKVEL